MVYRQLHLEKQVIDFYNIEGTIIKPQFVVLKPNSTEAQWLDANTISFANWLTQWVANQFLAQGLMLKPILQADIGRVLRFSQALYNPELSKQVTEYDLFRILEFGSGQMLVNPTGALVGIIFEVGYRSSDNSSYSIRLTIDETKGGANLARLLYTYSCAEAMLKGAKVKRGLIDLKNPHSLYLHLNKMGFTIFDYFDDVEGLLPSFKAMLHLTPKSMLYNRIDRLKLSQTVKNIKEFSLVGLSRISDVSSIKSRFSDGMAIVALVPGHYSGEHAFLWVEANSLITTT